MFKRIILSISLSLVGFLSTRPLEVPALSYEYQVIANSFEPSDLVHQYQVRDYILEVFENELLELTEKDRNWIMVSQPSLFALDGSVQVKVINGTVIAQIGEGKGPILSGSFQRFLCSEDSLEVRWFFLDWFLGNQ